MLPTGASHLALRLTGDPVNVVDSAAARGGRALPRAVVGGPRAGFYERIVPASVPSVGVQLRFGGALAVLGVPDSELAGRHTGLGDLWGAVADETMDRLREVGSNEERLGVLEASLVARMTDRNAPDPVVTWALSRFAAAWSVSDVVRESGYSHTQFVTRFRRLVGLTPKRLSRVLRFGRALRRLTRDRTGSRAAIALESGFADQAHFSREFRVFSGFSPASYIRRASSAIHHVPVDDM